MSGAAAAVDAAREAAGRLRAGGWPARAGLLRSLRLELAHRLGRYSGTVASASGKPEAEALLSELYPALEMLKYCEREGERLLRPRRVRTPLFFGGCSSRAEFRPYGAVLVVGPYNFPFLLNFIPAVTAIAAGNGVVIKPSELTPQIGPLLEALFAAAGAPAGLVSMAAGGPEAVRELIAAGPDKVFFTGGAAGGREVMKLCAEGLVPLALELGGKAPMLVFADADQERAVQGALYGAFCNAGQVCVSTERIYVERPAYAAFCRRLAAAALRVKPGGADGDYGPMLSARQADRVLEQVRAAVAAGARLLTPERREGNLLWPMVVADADHRMELMTAETFGPAVGVMPFDGEEEAVRLANALPVGLAASVWTGDAARADRVAALLEAGQVSVNDCIRAAGSPYLPFGGVKGSGFGRSHGPEGLYEFCRQTSVLESAGRTPSEVNWFPYGAELAPALAAALRAFFGAFSLKAWLAALGAGRSIKGRLGRRLRDG